ncbi:TrbM/KikA/MpfK family conjugal transfer protein [Pseudomonas kitaguniensis]|uniref:TrbM/KikA/MpfK family conjugal transfer protein n=1 Tax=Pseudomonas kitaguniensis TaxID=2607908 RepID=UPI003B9E9D82
MKKSVHTAGDPCLSVIEAVFHKKRTKLRLTTAALLVLFLTNSSTAFAGDPCKAVLCMFGLLTGNSGGGECKSATQEYFSIEVKKKGKIKWDQTSAAREQFLNSCPGSAGDINKKINGTFGKSKG